MKNKRILAVGTGDTLLEATPHGDVIRWVYDERMKRYAPITEDACSSYGMQLRKCSAVITPPAKQNDEQSLDEAFGQRPLDENDYCGAGW